MEGFLPRAVLKRYLAAVLSVFIATVPTIAIKPLFDSRAPVVLFALAVIFSAAYGGLGPGLLATALGAGLLLFQPEIGVMTLSAHANATVLAVIGVASSIAIEQLHRRNVALIRMLRTKDTLEATNEQLSERGEALSQANEELQRFAYALAHDLNAPLRGIAVLTDLLVRRNMEKLDEDRSEERRVGKECRSR